MFPVIVLVLASALSAWMFATDHFARWFGAIALALFSALLIGVWWALNKRDHRIKRLAVFAGSLAFLIVGFRQLLRYEGSADGTSLPKFSWKWSPSSEQVLPSLHSQTAAASDLGPVPDGLADSTRFMGPHGDGMIDEVGFKTDWHTNPPREVWRIPVGLGWSAFAVCGRRAVTQEQRAEEECVTCYDVVTGKLLWSHADKARFEEGMGGNGPRATPSIDPKAGLVLAQGATGILNCLDLTTGELKWTRNVLADSGGKNMMYGKSNAPLLHGEMVIVTGADAAPSLLCYRQSNGELAWKAGTEAAGYATPMIHTLGGREQLVQVNQTSVTGHDLVSGAVLWSYAWEGTLPKVCQPVRAGLDRLLVTSSYGVKSHLLEVKADAAGKLQCTSLWDSSRLRTKFSSATVLDGLAYAIDEGTLVCVDMTSGERVWREGRYGYGQHLQVGKFLLVQAESGEVVLAQPTREKLNELGRIQALSSKTWNPPTLAGRWLLVRNDREAVCYELP